jgi:SOS response regulatory protein OraA/RecX
MINNSALTRRHAAANPSVVGAIRRMQGGEIRGSMTEYVGPQLEQTLGNLGLSREEINEVLPPDKQRELTEQFFAVDGATWRNDTARGKHFADRIRDYFSKTDAGRKLSQKLQQKGVNADAFANTMAIDVGTAMQDAIEFDPATFSNNMTNLFQKQATTLDAAATYRGTAEVFAQISRTMGGERGGAIRRGISAFLDPDKTAAQAVASMFGFEVTADLQERLNPAFERVQKIVAGEDFRKEVARIGRMESAEQRAEATNALINEKSGLMKAVNTLRDEMDKAGLPAVQLSEKQRKEWAEIREGITLSAKQPEDEKAAMDRKEKKDEPKAAAGGLGDFLQQMLDALGKLIPEEIKITSGELTVKSKTAKVEGSASFEDVPAKT